MKSEAEDIESVSELYIGNIKFCVISHFKESSTDTIDTKVIDLMKKEIKNRMTKPNFL